MNSNMIAITTVFTLGLIAFLVSVALSFFVSGGGVFALGSLGVTLMMICPFAGMAVEDFGK